MNNNCVNIIAKNLHIVLHKICRFIIFKNKNSQITLPVLIQYFHLSQLHIICQHMLLPFEKLLYFMDSCFLANKWTSEKNLRENSIYFLSFRG